MSPAEESEAAVCDQDFAAGEFLSLLRCFLLLTLLWRSVGELVRALSTTDFTGSFSHFVLFWSRTSCDVSAEENRSLPH